MKYKIIYLLVAILLLFGIYFIYQTTIMDSEFGGADGEAMDYVHEIDPNYEPIAEPLWEPPGGETESLLFCLQGAIGALIIGWFFGYYYAINKMKNAKNANN
ncbi:Cobalt transport protein CbiN [Methanosarcinaceae archaeon Ag5]|uniref:Cobalt transport protein CbiN n=1 Tax=Methanolapillus africanus TaxID=3028297 RepID=A0AAE4SDS0_9EURY|nr:Cobalt transport protein CbiN [Methanosarcinaceae archaeon Ag5]